MVYLLFISLILGWIFVIYRLYWMVQQEKELREIDWKITRTLPRERVMLLYFWVWDIRTFINWPNSRGSIYERKQEIAKRREQAILDSYYNNKKN